LYLLDGKAAGQSVEHVHLHILPRRVGDFKWNDEVYFQIEKEKGRVFRSVEEMNAEAAMLRSAVEEQLLIDKGKKNKQRQKKKLNVLFHSGFVVE
jgi:diadenosine tetraphosphate (Ap4A) HIT family hydrolase